MMNAKAMMAAERNDEAMPGATRDLEVLLDTWELAKWSYGRVLQAGVERSDAQLAQDSDYRQLLQAGIVLRRLGGPSVVSHASKRLGTSVPNGCPEHFERLWAGLLQPETRPGSGRPLV
jgi:hypothetical protein